MANQTEWLTKAEGYRWLAQFFLHRPSLSELERYRDEDGKQFLGACKTVPALVPLAETFEEAAESRDGLEILRAALCRACSQAFDMGGPRSAPPYASVYVSERGLLYQQPARDMNRILELLQMNMPEAVKEPSDHLGVQLHVAAELCEREASGRSFAVSSTLFVETQVLTWLPAFVERCSQNTGSDVVCLLARTVLDYAKAHVEQGYARPADPDKVEALARVALQLVCMNYRAAQAYCD